MQMGRSVETLVAGFGRGMGNGSKPLRDALRQARVDATLRRLASRDGQRGTCSKRYLCGRCGGRWRARWERGAEAFVVAERCRVGCWATNLTVWLRRRCGVRRLSGVGARCCTGGSASESFTTRKSGPVVVRVVKRRRVVVLPGIVSSWASAWQRLAARLNENTRPTMRQAVADNWKLCERAAADDCRRLGVMCVLEPTDASLAHQETARQGLHWLAQPLCHHPGCTAHSRASKRFDPTSTCAFLCSHESISPSTA